MHVVIVGCGRVGSELTVSLARQGHTVSIVDKNPQKFERLPPGFEGQTLVGIAFDRETLEAAGIRDAGAFIAATNGDNSNIVSARVAREHYGVARVIARIDDPRRAEIYRRLGIPTVATVRWASAEILDLLFHGVEHAELVIGDGEMIMMRVAAPAELAGARIESLNEPGRFQVVAIDRMGSVFLPGPKGTFQQDDLIHVIVRRDAVDDLHERIQGDIV